MAIKIVDTNSGTDFSSVVPAILINTSGNYVAISGTAGGTGDVVGPGSATANAVALYSGASGKLIKNSALIYSAGTLAGVDNLSSATTLSIGAEDDISITSVNQRVDVVSLASDVNIAGSVNVDITADSGDVNITAPAGNVIISGLSLLNQVQVGNGGGFVSTAVGQNISLNASSGVTIGGNVGPISLGTTVSQISMSTSEAGDSGTVAVYPTSALMQVSSGGNEQYIQIGASPNPIITKGDFRPIASGTNSLGSTAFPYSGVAATSIITQSPNGAFWKITVSNGGALTAVSYP
jgi:hypothetical protein